MRNTLLTTLTAFAVLGCTTPFATEINGYDFNSPQAPAAVVLSDPQVYSRETLLNDRRSEATYLRRVLEDSADPSKVQFTPQLRRDLETLTGFVAQMNLLYDPAAADSYQRWQQGLNRQDEIDQINAEAALVRARAQLIQEQARLAAIERGETVEGGTPPTPPTVPGASQTQAPSLSELDSLIRHMDAIEALMQRAQTPARAANVSASPQEEFRDRQTYREEIRSTLADVELDDGHDIEGNSLFRLQFRATVMPGEHRGQFAIARITFSPPAMTDHEIAELYMSWLVYVNRELNRDSVERPRAQGLQTATLPRRSSLPSELRLIGAYSGLFDIVEIGDHDSVVLIAAPPTVARYLRNPVGTDVRQSLLDTLRAPLPQLGQPLPQLEQAPMPTEAAPPAPFCASTSVIETLNRALDAMDNHLREPTLALAVLVAVAQAQALSDASELNSLIARVSQDAVMRQGTIKKRAIAITTAIGAAHFSNLCSNASEVARLTHTFENGWHNAFVDRPDSLLGVHFGTFRSLIQDPRDRVREYRRNRQHMVVQADTPTQGASASGQPKFGEFRPIPRGDVAAISARPVDLSQRVSSVQGAANAVDLAIALRAQGGGGGSAGAAGANFVRRAVGRIDTLERAPIVVGFNDRRTVGACPDNSRLPSVMDCPSGEAARTLSQSGWVFGPRIQPGGNGSSLEPSQNLVNHAVSTDISAPGWWPRVQARLETAWVRNWDEAAHGNVFRDKRILSSRDFHIALPHNTFAMYALTRLLSGLGTPLATPQITSVTPSHVQVCPGADSIRIQVSGLDVWQGTEAYLNGVSAKLVRIQPDMGGVDLTFPATNLPLQPDVGLNGENAELVVWTRDSRDTYPITVERAPADTPFCEQQHGGGEGGGAVALASATTWFAPDSEVRLELGDAAALANRAGVVVRMRRYDPAIGGGSGSNYIQLATEAGATAQLGIGDNGLLSFNTPALPAATAGLEDGGLYELSVVISQRGGAPDAPPIVARRPVAYYAQANEVSIISTAVQLNGSGAPLRLVIEMPKRAEYRYAGFAANAVPDARRVQIAGTLAAGGRTFQLRGQGAWQADNVVAGRPRYAIEGQVTEADRADFWNAINGAAATGLPGFFYVTINGDQAGAVAAVNVKK